MKNALLVSGLLFLSFLPLSARGQTKKSGEAPPRELVGKVEDEGGRAVENATVAARAVSEPSLQAPLVTRTDRDGRFHLSNPRGASRYTVTVVAPGLAPWTKERVDGRDAMKVVLSRGVALEGFVRDGRTREVIVGARVEASAMPTGVGALALPKDARFGIVEAVTDKKGRFRLEALAPGLRTIRAAAHGYRRAEVTVSPHDKRVELFLLPGSGAHGTVRGDHGELVPGAQIFVLAGDERALWRRSGSDDVVLELERTGAIAGPLADEDGNPIASFTVHLEAERSQNTRITQVRNFAARRADSA